MNCDHSRSYDFQKHYPLRDPKGEYHLCPQCGLLWRKGTDNPPFPMVGYHRSVFMTHGYHIHQLERKII